MRRAAYVVSQLGQESSSRSNWHAYAETPTRPNLHFGHSPKQVTLVLCLAVSDVRGTCLFTRVLSIGTGSTAEPVLIMFLCKGPARPGLNEEHRANLTVVYGRVHWRVAQAGA